VSNLTQLDADGDGLGDACEGDSCSASATVGHLASAQLFVEHVADADFALDVPDTNAFGSPSSINWLSFTGVTGSASLFTLSLLHSDPTLSAPLLSAWWGSNSPSSIGYYNQSIAQSHFAQVVDINDVRPGDFVAINYTDQPAGHAILIEGCPSPSLLPSARW
jgi:hypothetical protein